MNPTTQPDLFTRLGMASASDEQKQALVEQVADLTMIRVMNKLQDRLSPEDMSSLEQLSEAGQDDQLVQRLRELAPDYEQLVEVTSREVADQLVEDQRAVLAKVRQDASTN